MGKLQVRTCDVPRCIRRPVHTWLLSGPSATYEVDLCNQDAEPMLTMARLGHQVGVPQQTEDQAMEGFWRNPDER